MCWALCLLVGAREKSGVQAALQAAGMHTTRMLIVDSSLRRWGAHLPHMLLAERYLFFPEPALPTAPGEPPSLLMKKCDSRSLWPGLG
jgi:hypothetical protein